MDSTPFDLMHVELEGNLKRHMYAMLYCFVKRYKLFSRAELNAALRSFKFDLDTSRRMPAVNSVTLEGQRDKKLGLMPSGTGLMPFTAGQMLQVTINSIELLRPLLERKTIVENGVVIPAVESDI